jgi:DNA polymerase III subunit delta
MRLPAARVAEFLRRPDPAVRAVLLFGPDAGLVRERADALARGVCPDLADPFRVAELGAAQLAADPARLADEVAAQSLVGGRRVVRVREAGDSLAKLFAQTIDDAPGDGFIVVEAGELPGRSSLRRAFEEARRGAAIGCWPDTPRDLAAVIRESLSERHVSLSRDAGEYLVAHLGGDRLQTRSELEKLALYAGEGGRVELADAASVVGDSAQLSLDDAVFAAAEGEPAALERALFRVFAEGASPVTVIRALLRHLQRLHLFAAKIAAGAGAAEVLRAARPPVFFKHEDNLKRQLALWNAARLARMLGLVAEAEFRMKLTGLPAETICRQAMLAVAQAARRRQDQ